MPLRLHCPLNTAMALSWPRKSMDLAWRATARSAPGPGALGDGPIYSTNALAHNVSLWDEAEEGSPADLGRDEVAASDEAARAEACVSGG